jgi:hypothetical protein
MGKFNYLKDFSILFLSLLLLLVNNCILPVALRDPGIMTSASFPQRRAARVWFCMLKTQKRSCDDSETFVMICNEYFMCNTMI